MVVVIIEPVRQIRRQAVGGLAGRRAGNSNDNNNNNTIPTTTILIIIIIILMIMTITMTMTMMMIAGRRAAGRRILVYV